MDTRELNLINHHQMKLAWNSTFLIPKTATYQGYDADNSNRISGVPQSGYWEDPKRMTETSVGSGQYKLASTSQPIQIRPLQFEQFGEFLERSGNRGVLHDRLNERTSRLSL